MPTPTPPPTSGERAGRKAPRGSPACWGVTQARRGLGEWVALARYFAECQLVEIEDAARGLAARDALLPSAPVVGAGCGRFVAKAVAERLGRPYLDFADRIDAAPEAREMAACCAPAVGVALLAGNGG